MHFTKTRSTLRTILSAALAGTLVHFALRDAPAEAAGGGGALFATAIALASAQVPSSGAGQGGPTSAPLVDPGWPRSFTRDGTTVTLEQPQIDAWQDHRRMKFRCAVEVQLPGQQPAWGVIAAQADTSVDESGEHVFVTNVEIVAINFPSTAPADAAALKAVVTGFLPQQPFLEISMSRVLAHMHDQAPPPPVQVNLAPPPIFYSATPAILVIFMGEPQFRPVAGTTVMRAVNTNWVVLRDPQSSQYYLLLGKSWLTAPDPVNGPWSAAGSLPSSFSSLPGDDHWTAVVAAIPGQPLSTVPTVYATTGPAELIVTNGQPSYSPIAGTSLMFVSNPTMPVFLDSSTSSYYYLVAGRWFSAPALTGPWSAASASLPADFARIPENSPVGFVLTSVPGTREAKDAVLLAQVPHTATIKTAGTTLDVTYDGTPQFAPISGMPAGSQLQYATNTAFQVVEAGNRYYCCSNGVWFVAAAATGPWSVATSVPPAIYAIPSSSPLYNVTYVRIYSTTPDAVVVGYTGGYTGAYVATTGVLMFGAGMALGAVLANNSCCWYGYPPCFYSYGCASYYHYGYGGFYGAGYAHYGPWGGATWAAGYNPATGTWARGGAAYGPGGAVWGGQAYNPWTNTYGQHTGGTNGYKSWGNSYVQRGSNWAEAGHETTARGTAGYAADSSGQWAEGAHSSATNSSIARTSGGNTYAGHDGNVYRNTGDGWQKYDGGGTWNNVQRPDAGASGGAGGWQQAQASQSQWRNNWNSSNLQQSWDNRGGGNQWADHETQNGLNRDAWARNYGNGGSGGWNDASRSWGGQSHGWGGGGGGWGGRGSFGGFRGGGGFHGGFRR
ncbi:MAG TPA: hypothetical protein PKC43_00075 [Phycisphaerales bacterium]|nr:hypothetical protein [Phycisphaerales bacterium]HMP35820.1 hypothetical protein [Phycisphaerales bacterium]